MEHLLEIYEKNYKKRFTRRQKRIFGKQLMHDMEEAGYQGKRIDDKFLLSRVENYVFGSLKTAKRVIIVPYDTPERKFWFQSPYYPFNGTRTTQKSMKATFVPFIILYVIILLGLWITNMIASPLLGSIVSFIMFLLVLFLIYFMLHGIANPNNAIRNTSSICTALSLAKRFNKDERRQTAFIFTDQNKRKFLGSQACIKLFEEAHVNPSIIILDCVGAPNDIWIGCPTQYRKMANELIQSIKNKQQRPEIIKMNEVMKLQHASQYFKRFVLLCAGSKDDDQEVVVYNTSMAKEKHVSMDNMKKVEEMLYTYIHQL